MESDEDDIIVPSNAKRRKILNQPSVSASEAPSSQRSSVGPPDKVLGNPRGEQTSNNDPKGKNERRKGKKSGAQETKKNAPEALKGANGGYAWEDEYRRSWDIVQEDESGSIEAIVSGLVESQKKRYLKNVTPFQRGIIRTVVLVLDYSSVMREKDFRPNRSTMMISYVIDFVSDFFDQNPISQLSIVIMRNGLAQVVSELSGNPNDHIEALKRLKRVDPEGDPSLQNALEMSRGLLLHVASHCTREILIIFGALFTSDPGNIHNTINALVKEKISIRVIGLTARVAICEELCKKTNFGDLKNSYNVVLNETHFKDLILDSVTPLAITKEESGKTNGFTLVKMGFPSRVSDSEPTLCSCHSRLVYGGYVCPNCSSRVCTLPTVCPCCDLMLILSTHLARSYHHLFPLRLFEEKKKITSYADQDDRTTSGGTDKGTISSEPCFSCQNTQGSRYMCPACKQVFCIDCDVFVHETLHNCPGCESRTTAV